MSTSTAAATSASPSTSTEKPLLESVLTRVRGNQTHAAEMLGINRNTLRKRLGELAIDPEEFTRRG